MTTIQGATTVQGISTVRSGLNPLGIAGLSAWYDASQIKGATAGGTLAAWTDLGPNGFDLTATGTPTFELAAQNSLPAVRFGGDGESYSAGSIDSTVLTGGTEVHFFFVHKITGIISHFCNLDTSTAMQTVDWNVSGDSLYFRFGGTGPANAGAPVGYQDAWHISEFYVTGESAYIVIDGTAFTDASCGSITGNKTFYVGKGSATTSQDFEGDIGEIIFYDNYLGATNAAAMRAHLKAKWDTP